MLSRLFLKLAFASVLAASAGGCSSASHSGTIASTSTPVLHSTPTSTLTVAPRVGDAAPNFSLDTLDGTGVYHLSDFPDRPVLLIFWSINCSPCTQEQPVIQRFYEQQQAAGKQLVVLGVDIDTVSDFVNVATVRQRLGLTYPILVDDHFQARTSYQITSVPVAYFLDRQHIIRSIQSGSLNETVLRSEASKVEQ